MEPVNDDVIAIEEIVGVGYGAWDMIDPQDLLNACANVLQKKINAQYKEAVEQLVALTAHLVEYDKKWQVYHTRWNNELAKIDPKYYAALYGEE